jgi:putative FmdB family regulatory protein
VPTYQYVCTNADDKHEFEVVQSFSDPSVTECPQCGSPVRKVYGSVGVVFKGSGFYRTDSRAGSTSSGSGSASSGGDKSGSGQSGGDKSGGKSGGDSAGTSSAGKDSGSSSATSKAAS